MLGNYDVPKNWPTPPKFSEPGAPPGPPIQWQPNTPQTATSGYGYVPAAEPEREREVFFYHSDHLGSTAYITDRNGAVSQFICYMPYGEALVDEHSASAEEQPYKFNGKEMDRETGLYYYGARYYDPSKSGVWYGIDPLTEKYPALSPYSYCAGNPVRYVDPDGRWVQIAIGAGIGAIVNGGIAIYEGKSVSQVLAATAGGAIAGALVSVGAGVLAGTVMGAIGGAAGNLAEQGINVAAGNQSEVDSKQVAISGAVGAFTGAAGKVLDRKIAQKAANATYKVENHYASEGIRNTIKNEIKSEVKQSGQSLGNSTRQQINKTVQQRLNNLKQGDKAIIQSTANGTTFVTNTTIEVGDNRINRIVND